MNKTVNYIDLSVPIDVKMWEPNHLERKIIDHRKGANLLGKTVISMKGTNFVLKAIELIKNKLGLGLNYNDFPDKKGLSLFFYKLTTHTGTHMDAPFHFGDKTSLGKKAKTITDIPLKWCFGNGVLLDLYTDSSSGPVSKKEIITKLKEINYDIKPFDIVFLRTEGDKYIGEPRYFSDFRGVSPEAAEYLIDKGVKIIGVDSFSFDPPFQVMIGKYLKEKKKKYLWPAHFLGRTKEYCHIERLCNLDKIKNPFGFKVSCFPIKLLDSDASWCRVVAIED
ncbi:MAG: cyclase family protein [bacterium]